MLAQWGITETPERRIAPKSAISGGAEFIANGEIEIGLYLLSEVKTVKGVAVAGMLPPAQQSYIVYAGAILADSAVPEPAAEFLKFIAEPSQAAAMAGDRVRGDRQEQLTIAQAGSRRPLLQPAVAISARAHELRRTIC